MVEVFLIKKKAGKYYTNFWDKKIYEWPTDIFREHNGIVSKATLKVYRKDYQKVRYGQ